MGMAWELISWSLGLPTGCWTTSTAVILDPLKVTLTCTGPHRVSTAPPVTVRTPPEAAAEEDVEGAADAEAVPEDSASGAVAAGTDTATVWCGLAASSSTTPR